MNDIIELIKKYRLLISPTVTGQWGAGIFQGVTLGQPGLTMTNLEAGERGFSGSRYCQPGTWQEAPTLEEAVNKVVNMIEKR